LITLGIIGIVAALTMPTLVANYQEKVIATKLKKAYSLFSDAYAQAIDDEDITTWFSGTNRAQNAEIFFNHLQPYLKISKDCAFGKGCLTPGYLKNLNGANYINYENNTEEYKFILADGAAIFIYLHNPACSVDDVCGHIKVDVDGFNGPYAWGKDVFLFHILSNRLLPAGAGDYQSFAAYCSRTSTITSNGVGCTAWVIYNENLDYLHCDDLSWGGKTKCSN
jgi:type II secretory pathway pseudopilin PulG